MGFTSSKVSKHESGVEPATFRRMAAHWNQQQFQNFLWACLGPDWADMRTPPPQSRHQYSSKPVKCSFTEKTQHYFTILMITKLNITKKKREKQIRALYFPEFRP